MKSSTVQTNVDSIINWYPFRLIIVAFKTVIVRDISLVYLHSGMSRDNMAYLWAPWRQVPLVWLFLMTYALLDYIAFVRLVILYLGCVEVGRKNRGLIYIKFIVLLQRLNRSW